MGVQALVRLHGKPIGYVKAPITDGRCTATTLSKLILEKHSRTIINRLLQNGLAAGVKSENLRLEDLFDVLPPEYGGELPLVTVAVCTRDHLSDLALCLSAINQLNYPHLEILVVDNAPTSDATERLVQTKYPHFRYVCEPRPGLDWACNRAIREARGESIAYTDDDIIVDSGWVKALAKTFAENPEVMAVTGLVVPDELETEAQNLFELYGGFGKGFDRKWYRVGQGNHVPWQLLGTGQFGTGANMASRRCLFEEMGEFDPALDVGTVTNGCGDLEMFFRVLKAGHTLVYEPSALVRHRHRREYENLRSQITNNGIGLYAYFVCGARNYPDERLSFLKLGCWWLLYWHLRRLWISFKHPTRLPRDLVVAELKGAFIGLTRYQKARKTAAGIAESFGSQLGRETRGQGDKGTRRELPHSLIPESKLQSACAIRTVELRQPLQALTNVTNYQDVQVFLTWNDRLLGSVNIANAYHPISRSRLIELIVNQLELKLLESTRSISKESCWAEAFSSLAKHYTPTEEEAALPERLSSKVPVSIVVATYDRPDDLRQCLHCLVAQTSSREIEIVVVDNNPASGVTPPVITEFPDVVLVSEPRKGLAYARNAGFVASTGEVLVATDDDVTMSPDWLENLVVPFARPEVMVVTGNVLPLELETLSQELFESYGGLGRGFEQFEADGDWFESFPRTPVPSWELGATANAAFRASMFSHPQIGLMYEALGPGMPSGVGEDTYLFYKVLKADYTLVYEPAAYVWHKHRRDRSALRRQIYGYSKGHVSYHLTTWLRDSDGRALVQLFAALPLYHYQQIRARLLGQSNYPLSLVWLEIAGNLAAPWSLWRSHQRVKREGRSAPYIPLSQCYREQGEDATVSNWQQNVFHPQSQP